jgi:NAD(P)-dependent dehydrogenase (short-subunit alcohol dehydrogenase family)
LARAIPKIDHLVTTAASLVFKPFMETARSDIDAMLGSKLLGPMHLVRHLVRHLVARMTKDKGK